MADLNRAKEIFSKRVEYPLPKKTGARDYIFYFVRTGDPYRDSGNAFFKKFYANHVAFDVRTLEDLIDALAAEVDRGVTHIREIAILSHGNALALQFPLFRGVTDTNLREYKYLTAFSLACLQKDLEAEKFPAFDSKRKKVIARVQDDSWLTIRACYFGRSQEAMYAFYAFFGGRPNVYSPMYFQFFGTPPIYDGMRLDSRLRVHEHLVRQHFHPKDVHTLERKDAIVTAILDRAKFSEPFEIASMRVDNPTPEEAAAYEPFIDQLNAGALSAKLKSVFADNGFTLSGKARVSEVSPNTQWTITDDYRHEESTFKIKYDVYESVEFNSNNRRIAVLRAGASLVDKPSGKETLPIQLFLSQGEQRHVPRQAAHAGGLRRSARDTAGRKQGAVRRSEGAPRAGQVRRRYGRHPGRAVGPNGDRTDEAGNPQAGVVHRPGRRTAHYMGHPEIRNCSRFCSNTWWTRTAILPTRSPFMTITPANWT